MRKDTSEGEWLQIRLAWKRKGTMGLVFLQDHWRQIWVGGHKSVFIPSYCVGSWQCITFLSKCFSNGFVYFFIRLWGTLNPSILSQVEEIQTSVWLCVQTTEQRCYYFGLALCPLTGWFSHPLSVGRTMGRGTVQCCRSWGCWGVSRGTLNSEDCHQWAASSAAETPFHWSSANDCTLWERRSMKDAA